MTLQQLAGQSEAFFSASSYLASSATSKMNSLWSEVTADSNPGEFPSKLGLAGIFVESMEPTFSTKGDAMEGGYFGSHRTKYIHSVGAHGKVVLNSTGAHPFTGLFQGANHGIVRLSSAAKPELGTSAPLGPGMGLKFLRDGIDSANLVAMYGVNGQPGEWNFFAHEFQNHIKLKEPLSKLLLINSHQPLTGSKKLVSVIGPNSDKTVKRTVHQCSHGESISLQTQPLPANSATPNHPTP